MAVEGKNDVLSLALGTPEHNGRVRGVGKYFTPTTFFDIPKRVSKSTKLEAQIKVLTDKLRKYENIFVDKGISISSLEEYMASNSAKSDNRKRKENSYDEQLSSDMCNKRSRPSKDIAFEVNSRKQAQVILLYFNFILDTHPYNILTHVLFPY